MPGVGSNSRLILLGVRAAISGNAHNPVCALKMVLHSSCCGGLGSPKVWTHLALSNPLAVLPVLVCYVGEVIPHK